MFIGHGLLAFALVALAGRSLAWASERTLWLAVLAGAFATLPDVDIVYAPVGLLGGVSGVFGAAEAFWQTGNIVHRAMTHSLLVGVVAALAFGCWTGARDWHASGSGTRRGLLGGAVGLALLCGLVVAATVATGGLAGIIMTIFVLGGLGITTVAARRGIAPVDVAGMALVGLLSHPFGDLVTGEPPALLYPLDIVLVAERVVLHPDPTFHLLGAFVLELSTFWLAAVAYSRLKDRRLRTHISPRATAGLGYAGVAVVLPAPTLELSSPFVFSVLAVGFVGSVGIDTASLRGGWPLSSLTRRDRSLVPRSHPVRLADVPTTLLTGLSAVTLAVAAYALAYLFI